MAADPLRELSLLLRSPEPDELRAFVERECVGLGFEKKLRGCSDTECEAALRSWLTRTRERCRKLQARETRARALAAARTLVDTARWHDDEVHLDERIVLGELLADRTLPILCFVVEGTEVYVERARLAAAKRALRRMATLWCWVDRSALHLWWEGDRHRGGLRLHCRRRHPGILTMVFHRSVPVPDPMREPTPRDQPGVWLGEVVAELGFLP